MGQKYISSRWFYNFFLLLLSLLAIQAIFLSAVLSSQYYSYLPFSDTWSHVDFLIKSFRGELDFQALFEPNNEVHIIAIPKLIYFVDSLFFKGSGGFVAASAYVFFISIPVMIGSTIYFDTEFSAREKVIACLVTFIVMCSPLQVESLLNPINMQWIILVFFITTSAISIYAYHRTKKIKFLFLALLWILLSGLSSASFLMVLIPAIIIVVGEKIGRKKTILSLGILSAITLFFMAGYEFIRMNFYPDNIPVIYFPLLKQLGQVSQSDLLLYIREANNNYLKIHINYIKNLVDLFFHFTSPLISESKSNSVFFINLAAVNILFLFAIKSLVIKKNNFKKMEVFIFICTIAICFFIGVIRSHFYGVYNHRFVSLSLLFNLSVFLICIKANKTRGESLLVYGMIFIYLASLSYVGFRQTGAYIYHRNHLRTTPLAYSLDIHNWGLVEELAGLKFGTFDFAFVQSEKQKLKNAGYGIYASEEYSLVGKNISLLKNRRAEPCEYFIEKVSLVSDQPAYRVDGNSKTLDGSTLTQVFITDSGHQVIGYGRSVTKYPEAHRSIFLPKSWTGLANMTFGSGGKTLFIYAYDDNVICNPYSIDLP